MLRIEGIEFGLINGETINCRSVNVLGANRIKLIIINGHYNPLLFSVLDFSKDC